MGGVHPAEHPGGQPVVPHQGGHDAHHRRQQRELGQGLAEQVEDHRVQQRLEGLPDEPGDRRQVEGGPESPGGTDPDQGGPTDDGYSPHKKPAEDVLTAWYSAGLSAGDDPAGPVNPEAAGLNLSVPNPYPPGAPILLRLPERFAGEKYDLAIFDLRGRRVALLAAERNGDLELRASWDGRTSDGRRAASGVYHCVARSAGGGGAVSRPIVVAR